MSTELTPFDLQVLNTVQLERANLTWTQKTLVTSIGVFERRNDGKMQIATTDRPSTWVRALSLEGCRKLAEFHDSLLGEVLDVEACKNETRERAQVILQLNRMSGGLMASPSHWDNYSLEDLREFLSDYTQQQTSAMAANNKAARALAATAAQIHNGTDSLDAAVYRQQVLRNMSLAANPAVVATPEPPTVEPVTLPKGHLLSRLLGR